MKNASPRTLTFVKRPPVVLTASELGATLSIWKSQSEWFFGVITAGKRVFFGSARIDTVTEEMATVDMPNVIKIVEVGGSTSDGGPPITVRFALSDVIVAYHAATADLETSGVVDANFDESVAVVLHDKTVQSVSLYRTSPFKKP
jgi:hypothetical protein